MLSIVIPTFKEAENVEMLVPRIHACLADVFPGFEIVLVDDFTGDGLEEVAARQNRQCGNCVTLITRRDKKGLASAWKDGINASRHDTVAIMDADLAHDPADLLRMCEARAGADMVVGSRYMPGHVVRMKNKSAFAIYLSVVAQHLARAVLGLSLYDMSHSFRVFDKKVFKAIEPRLDCEGNAMMIQFTFYAVQAGFRVKEIPVSYGERVHGETKLSILKEGTKFLKVLLRIRNSGRAARRAEN